MNYNSKVRKISDSTPAIREKVGGVSNFDTPPGRIICVMLFLGILFGVFLEEFFLNIAGNEFVRGELHREG